MHLIVLQDYSLEDYSRCTQAGLRGGLNVKGVYVSAGVSGGYCNALLNEMGGKTAYSFRVLFMGTQELTLKLWGHGVFPQRIQCTAAWWRTLLQL